MRMRILFRNEWSNIPDPRAHVSPHQRVWKRPRIQTCVKWRALESRISGVATAKTSSKDSLPSLWNWWNFSGSSTCVCLREAHRFIHICRCTCAALKCLRRPRTRNKNKNILRLHQMSKCIFLLVAPPCLFWLIKHLQHACAFPRVRKLPALTPAHTRRIFHSW